MNIPMARRSILLSLPKDQIPADELRDRTLGDLHVEQRRQAEVIDVPTQGCRGIAAEEAEAPPEVSEPDEGEDWEDDADNCRHCPLRGINRSHRENLEQSLEHTHRRRVRRAIP